MIWVLGMRTHREELYDGFLRMGTMRVVFVYKWMFAKGNTEEEALNNQEEKMTHFEGCIIHFSQPSWGHMLVEGMKKRRLLLVKAILDTNS